MTTATQTEPQRTTTTHQASPISRQKAWTVTAWCTKTRTMLSWTCVEAVDATDAHIKGRDRLAERLGGFGGWTVTTKRVQAPELARAWS